MVQGGLHRGFAALRAVLQGRCPETRCVWWFSWWGQGGANRALGEFVCAGWGVAPPLPLFALVAPNLGNLRIGCTIYHFQKRDSQGMFAIQGNNPVLCANWCKRHAQRLTETIVTP